MNHATDRKSDLRAVTITFNQEIRSDNGALVEPFSVSTVDRGGMHSATAKIAYAEEAVEIVADLIWTAQAAFDARLKREQELATERLVNISALSKGVGR